MLSILLALSKIAIFIIAYNRYFLFISAINFAISDIFYVSNRTHFEDLLTQMAINYQFCAAVPLNNYSLTHTGLVTATVTIGFLLRPLQQFISQNTRIQYDLVS